MRALLFQGDSRRSEAAGVFPSARSGVLLVELARRRQHGLGSLASSDLEGYPAWGTLTRASCDRFLNDNSGPKKIAARRKKPDPGEESVSIAARMAQLIPMPRAYFLIERVEGRSRHYQLATAIGSDDVQIDFDPNCGFETVECWLTQECRTALPPRRRQSFVSALQDDRPDASQSASRPAERVLSSGSQTESESDEPGASSDRLAFQVGENTRVPYFLRSWDDEGRAYKPGSISCTVSEDPLNIPDDIDQIRRRIAAEYEAQKQPGAPRTRKGWNGPLYGLILDDHLQDASETHLIAHLTLYRTWYAHYLATVASAKDKVVQNYVPQNAGKGPPVPFLAVGIGIVGPLFTSDGCVVLTRRSETAPFRPGELDVTIAEGLHPEKDVLPGANSPDAFHALERAFMEESKLGKQNIARSDILAFGVETECYQFGFLAAAETELTAKQVEDAITNSGSASSEVAEVIPIHDDPETVFRKVHQLINDGYKMGPIAFAALSIGLGWHRGATRAALRSAAAKAGF